MKRVLLTVALILSGFMPIGCSGITAQQKKLVGTLAPPTEMPLLNYSSLTLTQCLGRPVVISFWDAGCAHCKQSMPKVNALARSFTGGDAAVFIAVNVNNRADEERVRDAIGYLGLDAFRHVFSGYAGNDETYRAFQGVSVPYFILIDRRGVIRWIGDSSEELQKEFLKIV